MSETPALAIGGRSMSPEFPFLAAGAVALIGGARREGGFPRNGVKAVVGTIVLVLVASTTAGTSVAPLVRAIGLVLLMAAVMAAAKSNPKRK